MPDDNAKGQNQPKPASPPPPPPAQAPQAKPAADPKATAQPKKYYMSEDYRDDEPRGGKNAK